MDRDLKEVKVGDPQILLGRAYWAKDMGALRSVSFTGFSYLENTKETNMTRTRRERGKCKHLKSKKQWCYRGAPRGWGRWNITHDL